MPYAGFILRLVACALDAVIIFLVGMSLLFIQVIILPFPMSPEFLGLDFGVNSNTMGALLISQLIICGMYMIPILWLYSAGLESSSIQGTIGKHALKLIVTDTEGRRLSFLRASLRFIGKILSAVPLFLGFFLVAATGRKQGLDDFLAGTLVLHPGTPAVVQDPVYPVKIGEPSPQATTGSSNLAWYLIVGCVLVIFFGPIVMSGIMLLSYHPSHSAESTSVPEGPGSVMAVQQSPPAYWSPVQGSVSAVPAVAPWTRVVNVTPFQPRRDYPLTVFHGKFWVIGGDSYNTLRNTVWSSADGKTWDLLTDSAPFMPRYGHGAVVYNDRLWVVGGRGESADGKFQGLLNDVWSSPDGRNWSLETSSAAFPPRNDLSLVTFAGRMWVIGGAGESGGLSDIWSSTDGRTWTLDTASAPFSTLARASVVESGSRLWLFEGNSYYHTPAAIWSSADGRAWTQMGVLPFLPAGTQAVVAADGSFFGVHDDLMTNGEQVRGLWYSPDGVNWTELPGLPGYAGPYQFRAGPMYDEFRMVAVRDRLVMFREYPLPDNSVKNDVWFAAVPSLLRQPPEARFMASSVYGPAPLPVTFTDFSINNPDRWTWNFGDGMGSSQKSPVHVFATPGNYTVSLTVSSAFGNQSASRTIRVEAPAATGKKWVQAVSELPFEDRYYTSIVEHNGKLWIAGGSTMIHDFNDVWSSPDGITWEPATRSAPFSPRSGNAFLSHNGSLWVIGGLSHKETGFYKKDEVCNNDVWSSQDGVTWTLVTPYAGFAPRCSLVSAVYDNKMWVAGGRGSWDVKNFSQTYNDLWYSSDGITWVNATRSVDITPRFISAAFVFDHSLWIYGWGDTGILWRSDDGIHWKAVPVAPGQYPSSTPSVVLVQDNKIWFIQGSSWGSRSASPVWYSDDGSSWTTFSPEFSVLSKRGSWMNNGVVFNNRMWLIGDGEIWYSDA